jgi:hypothetical protein
MHIRYIHRPLVWLAATLLVGAVLFVVIRQARASEPPKPGLLPNLVATAPEEVEFETSNNDGDLSKAPEEARLLLRFNGYLHNDGSGALDMRGSRAEPQVGQAAKEEVGQREKELQEADEGKRPEEPQELSEKTEQELTSPRMGVFQRLYTETGKPPVPPEQTKKYNKENEEYLKRANEEMASSAEMLFVNADGHHHWHLQHVAKYSLWNAAKTAEVAPAQKVGFCLEDSEHVEVSKGPPGAIYSDDVAPYRDFCQRYQPYTTHVYEGISPGWRDDYSYQLGFQWVDVSDVMPGEYWLREEINPEHTILEEGKGEKVAYATKPTIVPGFDALAQTVGTTVGKPVTVTAASSRWESEGEPLGEPDYTVVSGPQHGTLKPVSGTDEAIYTPEAGYSGPDSFTYSASDPSSEFPRHPEVATVAIEVDAQAPSVAISGAPSKMYAGTSVQLSAVTDDDSEVTWNASAGSITSSGLYTAPAEPPIGGAVLIAARSAQGAEDQIMVIVEPVPSAQDQSAAPLSSAPGGSEPSTPGATSLPLPGKSFSHPPALYRPEAMLIGRELIMTTRVSNAGRVRLSAYIGHRRLGTCSAKTPGNRSFTCRLTLGKRILLNTRIAIVASLRIGRRVLSSLRPAAPVPQMKMNMGNPSTKRVTPVLGHDASSWRSWWCGPSMGM